MTNRMMRVVLIRVNGVVVAEYDVDADRPPPWTPRLRVHNCRGSAMELA